MTNKTIFSEPITSIVVYPPPIKLTFLQWLGLKKRPPIVTQRVYIASGSGLYVSDVEGKFDQ